jgi:hypothetical protein
VGRLVQFSQVKVYFYSRFGGRSGFVAMAAISFTTGAGFAATGTGFTATGAGVAATGKSTGTDIAAATGVAVAMCIGVETTCPLPFTERRPTDAISGSRRAQL